MESESLAEARLRHQLDIQTHQISKVMSHHRIPVTILGGKVEPRNIRYDLQAHLTTGWDRMRGLVDDLKAALGVRGADLKGNGTGWDLRIPREDEPPVSLLAMLAEKHSLEPVTAVIGLADGGQPVLVQFSPRKVSHILIAGDEGAGKTSLLRTFAVGLAHNNRQSQLQLVVIDPLGYAGSALQPLTWLPHMLTDTALDHETAAALLTFLVEEMDFRRKSLVQYPRIIVLIDHVVALIEKNHASKQNIIRLLQYGPQNGIHLVMATAQSDSPLFDTTFKANVTIKLVGRIQHNSPTPKVAGTTVDQAAALYGGGDFIALRGENQTYLQAAYIGDYDLHLALTELNRVSKPRLLAQTFDPRPHLVNQSSNQGNSTSSFTIQDGSVVIANPERDEIPFTID